MKVQRCWGCSGDWVGAVLRRANIVQPDVMVESASS